MPTEHNVEQGSAQWHYLRAGIPTVSRFSRFLKQSFGLRDSEGSRGFAMELAAERIVGGPLTMDDRTEDGVMGRGHALEGKARAWYEFYRSVEVRETGVVISDDGKVGASPDGLVGDDGMVEIKNPMTKQHVRNLLGDPPASEWQVQGALWVTGRAWCDVISWTEEPALGPVLVRIEADEVIHQTMAESCAKFEQMIQNYVKRLEAMGTTGRIGSAPLHEEVLESMYGPELAQESA